MQFEVPCTDPQTQRDYTALTEASTLERAKIRARNEGHHVKGMMPPSPDIVDNPIIPEVRTDSQVLLSIEAHAKTTAKAARLAYFLMIVGVVIFAVYVAAKLYGEAVLRGKYGP